MPTLRLSCPSCRVTLNFEPDQILLAVRPVLPATYTILCHACGAVGAVSVKRADALVAGLMRTAGVTAVAGASPHPEAPPSGPPLSYDDLLDLHLLLAIDGWLRKPTANVRRGSGGS